MSITAYSSSFSPLCSGGISTAGVTTAATAYDWFATSGSGAFATAISNANIQNKAFLFSIGQLARADLLPLVKAELFHAKLTTYKSLITSNVDIIKNTLDSIISSPSTISVFTPSYTATLSTLNGFLNTIKSFEAKIYATTDGSIDVSSASIATSYAATTTLTSFTGVKTYLSALIDPAILGNSGTAIPALTSVNNNVGNAAALNTIFSTAKTALTYSTLTDNNIALVEMSAKNIFDLYCMEAQGFASSGTTGKWPTGGTATAGIVPGIDYEVHLTGEYQTGTASAGTAGAPSATVSFW